MSLDYGKEVQDIELNIRLIVHAAREHELLTSEQILVLERAYSDALSNPAQPPIETAHHTTVDPIDTRGPLGTIDVPGVPQGPTPLEAHLLDEVIADLRDAPANSDAIIRAAQHAYRRCESRQFTESQLAEIKTAFTTSFPDATGDPPIVSDAHNALLESARTAPTPSRPKHKDDWAKGLKGLFSKK